MIQVFERAGNDNFTVIWEMFVSFRLHTDRQKIEQKKPKKKQRDLKRDF